MRNPDRARQPHESESAASHPSFVITGELELRQADRVEPQLLAYARDTGSDQLVIDCTGLTFVDSSGLGMLVDVRNETGKQLVLKNVTPSCRHVFEVTGLDTVFDFC